MSVGAGRVRVAQAGPIDKWVLAPVVSMVMIGVVMIYSSSFAEAFQLQGAPSFYLLRQLQWLIVGSIALLVASRVDYHHLRRFSVAGMGLAVLALAAVVYIPAISPVISGARRWIVVGPLQAQPSEFAKAALILYAADWLSQKGDKVRNLWYGTIPFGIIMGVLIGLVMLEPDMGTSLVIAAIGASMFFVAGAHLLQMFGGLVLAAGAFSVLIATASYRLNRLSIFLNPWRDPDRLGYHPIQALLAIGSGGFSGLGLGASRQKFNWLPEAHTDSIMAVIGEELGFVGCVLIIVMIVTIAVRGYRIAMRTPDAYGSLLAVGITSWIVFQGALNIAVITLLVPFTGIPLPFISYGGSSLVVTMTAIGILLNISRYASEGRPRPSRAGGRARFRRGAVGARA